MTVYDSANELATQLRMSHEYKILKEAKTKLEADKAGKDMVDEFLKLGQEIEIARYQKKEVPKESQEKLDSILRTLSLNNDAMEYLNAFQRFQLMFQDVSKTITDVVKDVID